MVNEMIYIGAGVPLGFVKDIIAAYKSETRVENKLIRLDLFTGFGTFYVHVGYADGFFSIELR